MIASRPHLFSQTPLFLAANASCLRSILCHNVTLHFQRRELRLIPTGTARRARKCFVGTCEAEVPIKPFRCTTQRLHPFHSVHVFGSPPARLFTTFTPLPRGAYHTPRSRDTGASFSVLTLLTTPSLSESLSSLRKAYFPCPNCPTTRYDDLLTTSSSDTCSGDSSGDSRLAGIGSGDNGTAPFKAARPNHLFSEPGGGRALPAHLTLFHALPSSHLSSIKHDIRALCVRTPRFRLATAADARRNRFGVAVLVAGDPFSSSVRQLLPPETRNDAKSGEPMVGRFSDDAEDTELGASRVASLRREMQALWGRFLSKQDLRGWGGRQQDRDAGRETQQPGLDSQLKGRGWQAHWTVANKLRGGGMEVARVAGEVDEWLKGEREVGGRTGPAEGWATGLGLWRYVGEEEGTAGGLKKGDWEWREAFDFMGSDGNAEGEVIDGRLSCA